MGGLAPRLSSAVYQVNSRLELGCCSTCLFFGRGFFPSCCSQVEKVVVSNDPTLAVFLDWNLDYTGFPFYLFIFLRGEGSLSYLRAVRFLLERAGSNYFQCVFHVVCSSQVIKAPFAL